MSNVAQDVLWPTDPNVLVRVGMLYVGQGDSSVVIVKDGSGYKSVLIDINRDKEGNHGINIPKLMKDLLRDQDGRLDLFVNTHPHNDHLDDITALSEAVDIHEVWESGHVPGKDDRGSYDELQAVIKKVKKQHGNEAASELAASRTSIPFGDAEIYVLSPATYVKDSIADEEESGRRRRIHEHCGVLRFGKDATWVLFTGDADRTAWEEHITDYHADRLPSQILSAAHHGSRTFFKDDEDDVPYMKALETIDPDYVIISAPKQSESRHGHPHDDAMQLYEDHVGKDNVLHCGANRECYICDIFTDGTYEVRTDTSLVDAYGRDNDEDEETTESKSHAATAAIRVAAPTVATRLDRRPMGNA
ncbi:competence protein ComEC [bacterium]|nr:competence protein ComEC [bacterium]